MAKLSKSEEQLMEIIWERKTAFMKEIIESYPDPKPANTTIATLLKRIREKKFIDFKLFGNSRQYFPLVKKEDYFSQHVNGLIRSFFGNSALKFASFFTKETNLSKKELEQLKSIIDQEIEKKKKL